MRLSSANSPTQVLPDVRIFPRVTSMSERQGDQTGGPRMRPIRTAEERATAEILALAGDLQRERDAATRSLEELRSRVGDVEAGAGGPSEIRVVAVPKPDQADEPESAGLDAGAEKRPTASATRLQQEAAQQIELEAQRLRSEFDEQLRSAVEKTRTEVESRMRMESNRLLAEQAEKLQAESDERVEATVKSVRAETERRVQAEIDELTRALESERGPRRAEIERDERAAAAAPKSSADEQDTREEPGAERPQRRGLFAWLRRRSPAEPGAGEEPAIEVRAFEPAEAPAPGEPVNVNEATFEQLRELGMSVTQATRVIAYRERRDGFESVDQMDTIPGLPKPMLDALKQKLTV